MTTHQSARQLLDPKTRQCQPAKSCPLNFKEFKINPSYFGAPLPFHSKYNDQQTTPPHPPLTHRLILSTTHESPCSSGYPPKLLLHYTAPIFPFSFPLPSHRSQTLPPMSERGSFRGGRGGGRGGRQQQKTGGGAAQQEKPKKENILDLGKYMDKEVQVKFNGGREGTL